MTAIDWIIVVFTLVMAVWGYAQGLIVGALSLAGFGVGRVPRLAARAAAARGGLEVALRAADRADGRARARRHPGVAVRGARLPHAAGAAQRIGEPLRVVDGVGGAALLAFVGLGVAWIAGAVALQTPGLEDLRRDIQRSSILAR